MEHDAKVLHAKGNASQEDGETGQGRVGRLLKKTLEMLKTKPLAEGVLVLALAGGSAASVSSVSCGGKDFTAAPGIDKKDSGEDAEIGKDAKNEKPEEASTQDVIEADVPDALPDTIIETGDEKDSDSEDSGTVNP